jgi:hypothetical protein
MCLARRELDAKSSDAVNDCIGGTVKKAECNRRNGVGGNIIRFYEECVEETMCGSRIYKGADNILNGR